jgi:hypothetical protein
MVAGANNYTQIDEALHTLMNGSAGHFAFRSYIFKGDTGIFSNNVQNMLVKIIYLFHFYIQLSK